MLKKKYLNLENLLNTEKNTVKYNIYIYIFLK